MRTAADFNLVYASPDPWLTAKPSVRERNLRRFILPIIEGKSVLELGCGEGHLTRKLLSRASNVTAIDISSVAISRAQSQRIANATFFCGDFLDISFARHDIVLALECLYYLSIEEQERFFGKLAREHAGRLIALSSPIIDDARYFSRDALPRFAAAMGFHLVDQHNLSIYWKPFSLRIVANLAKLPSGHLLVDILPDSVIYQRLYLLRAPIA